MPIPNDSVEEIRDMYRKAQASWTYKCSQMLMKILNDATAIGSALGEISREEAIEALKRQAVAAIEAMK